MMLRRNCTRRWGALVGHAVLLAVPSLSLAGAGFSSGSATWSWDADTNSTLGGKTVFAIAPPSSSALPTSPTFQLNRTGTSGTTSATGKGSIGYVANSTTASWVFAGGSGAAQSDPTNLFTGDTITKVQFGGLFDVTSPSFGPTATGYFSLTVAGTAGVGGSTQVAYDMQWRLNGPNGALLRSAISAGTTFFGGAAPTPFSATYTYCTPFSPSTVLPSDNIWVGGSMTFIADNSGTPSDTAPIQFEASAAPPTATFFGVGGASGWFDSATWSAPNNPAAGVFSFQELNAAVPIVPNAVGERARIVNNSLEARDLVLTSPVTLGALQIDDNNDVSLLNNGQALNTLTMDVFSGSASIYGGSSSGRAIHQIQNNVVLADDLDVRVTTDQPRSGTGTVMNFDGSITNLGGGAGAPRNVTIGGGGIVGYNAANSYLGQTFIGDGATLQANAIGCLGTGTVTVSDGRLEINTAMPFQGSGNIVVNAGGQVVLSVSGMSGAFINITSTGGISGESAVLGQTQVNGPGTAVNISQGGYVGHLDFDTTAAGNPQGIGTVPLFIFAISRDFIDTADPSITVGTGSSSPWVGFGSDALNRTYGATNTAPQTVTIIGQGSLFSGGGDLTLNARLSGGPAATVDVRGSSGGAVRLNSILNDFAGNMSVGAKARLVVDGLLPAVQSINVGAGGSFGGTGSVGGTVTIENGGEIDPATSPFNNVTGALTVNNMVLNEDSVLEFEFGNGGNDTVYVTGSLTLDGDLIINQLQDFDNQSTYTLFTYAGTLIDNGLTISPTSQEIFGLPVASVASILIIPNPVGGGTVVLTIPEPATASVAGIGAAMVLLRRGRRMWA